MNPTATTMAKKSPTPKSQSEQAEDRRKRAKEARLERSGTAILEGDPGKAAKILDAAKDKKPKKPTAAQAVEILSAAHTLEMQITALDHKIDGIKEEYKELKAKREVLFGQLRMEVRDMKQGRLPFQSGLDAGGKAPKKDDAVDAELAGDPVKDAIDGAPTPAKGKDLPNDAKKDPEPKKKAEGKAA